METRYYLVIWRLFSNPSCYSCFAVINFLWLSICKLWNADKLIKTYLIQRSLLIFLSLKFYHYHVFLLFFWKVVIWYYVAQSDLQLFMQLRVMLNFQYLPRLPKCWVCRCAPKTTFPAVLKTEPWLSLYTLAKHFIWWAIFAHPLKHHI